MESYTNHFFFFLKGSIFSFMSKTLSLKLKVTGSASFFLSLLDVISLKESTLAPLILLVTVKKKFGI